MANARITFYDIQDCGYFKRGGEAPVFGDATAMLAGLKDWSEKVLFGATRIKGVGGRGCYAIEAKKLGQNNDWLLVLWNESHNHENNIPSVHLNSKKGEPIVRKNGVEEGTVPGFPTYFLFLPDKKKFGVVRFEGDSSCLANLRLYVEGFMRSFSPTAVMKEGDDGGMKLAGHIDPNDAEKAVQKVRPRFRFKVKLKSSDVSFIKGNRAKIKRVIRQEVLNGRLVDEKTRLTKVLDFLRGGAAGGKVIQDTVKVEYSVDYTPDADELDGIIATYKDDEDSDIGFKFAGDGHTRWLGRGLASDVFALDDVQQEDGVVVMETLTRALQRHRVAVLQLADG